MDDERTVTSELEESALALTSLSNEATPAKRRSTAMPKWERVARARLQRVIRSRLPRLEQLVTTRANEFATLQFVCDFAKVGLGYEEAEIITQQRLDNGEIADCMFVLDAKPSLLIEVKRAASRLHTRHRSQLEDYAAIAGIEWAVLTNGREWEVHRITVPAGRSSVGELVFRAALSDKPSVAEQAGHFYYLTRDSVLRDQLLDCWKRERALSTASLARALTSKPVLHAIRRQLHSQRGGVLLDTKDIAERVEEVLSGPPR